MIKMRLLREREKSIWYAVAAVHDGQSTRQKYVFGNMAIFGESSIPLLPRARPPWAATLVCLFADD